VLALGVRLVERPDPRIAANPLLLPKFALAECEQAIGGLRGRAVTSGPRGPRGDEAPLLASTRETIDDRPGSSGSTCPNERDSARALMSRVRFDLAERVRPDGRNP
jgi:hypothetical protein